MRYSVRSKLAKFLLTSVGVLDYPSNTLIIWHFFTTCWRSYMVEEEGTSTSSSSSIVSNSNNEEINKKIKRNRYRSGIKVRHVFKFCFAVLAAVVFFVGHYQLVTRYTKLFDIYDPLKSDVKLFRREVHGGKIKPKLSFPKEYHVTGILRLPYGDIVEPFEAWYSAPQKMSRIDYYGGMDKTYQREEIGAYGFAAKAVPEYSEIRQEIFKGCLHRIGTKRLPIKAQSVVPSPLLFKFKGACKFNNTIPCWKWGHKFTILTKANTYTLYTTRGKDTIPLRYEMMGYDTLLASYYDKYVLDYANFTKLVYDFNIFAIPAELDCFDQGRTDDEVSMSAFNPMLEFISHQNEAHIQDIMPNISQHLPTISDDELTENLDTDSVVGRHLAKHHFEYIVETLFREFKNKFEKGYNDELEHVKRKDIFRHNMRFINTRNRQNITYRLKMNHFGDVTEKEMTQYKGLLNDSQKDDHAKPFTAPIVRHASHIIPISLDWRDYGAVASVQSQGICGSCYAYAVTGAMVGAYYLKTGDLIDLSEQQIIDCSWGFGNKGCKGGYPYRAMQWVIKHGGVATQKSYGRYLAQEGYCHFENTTTGAAIDGYLTIAAHNSTQLKMALALHGPVTVLINTRPKSFKFYDSGIYYDKDCDRRLDHAALLVGYGEDNGQGYWLVKNSWSASWGDDGYIKISMMGDDCGVTQNAVVVLMKS